MDHTVSDTRTVLLHAAATCFAEHGFNGASMRMIANRAERPLSLLFHHFGNKDGLYLAVFEYLFETSLLNNQQNPVPEGGHVPRDKAEARRMLREQIHFLYGDVMRNAGELDPVQEFGARLFLQEMRAPRPALIPMVTRHIAPVTNTLKNCIRVLRPDLGMPEIAFLGASLMGSIISHGSMYGMNKFIWEDAQAIGSQFQASEWLVEFCCNGLLGCATPD